MALETPALLDAVLATGHGEDAQLDPAGAPPGPTFRVLFSQPYLGSEEPAGTFANSDPELYAKTSDVTTVVPELTIVRVRSVDFVVQHAEPVEGEAAWVRLALRRA